MIAGDALHKTFSLFEIQESIELGERFTDCNSCWGGTDIYYEVIASLKDSYFNKLLMEQTC